MAKRTYSPNAKGRILEVAKKIFAKKGFDGSRVDEIAKTAQVPKSLIYYHFKSKDAILEELLNSCLEEYKTILTEVSQTSSTADPANLAERIRTTYFSFLEQHEDVIRIISMEALKKKSQKAHLAFKFVESFIMFQEELLKQNGLSLTPEARAQRMVTEFFTSFIPVTIFSCFRNAWSDYFETDADMLAQQFLAAYNATYGAYRREL